MKYLLKQWIAMLAHPLTLALALLALALIFRWRRRATAARSLAACAALLAYLASTSFVGNLLLSPLESQYPSLAEDSPPPPVAFIVVLGSGYDPRGHVTTTTALDGDGLARIVEGVSLARRLGAARLIVSGGAPPGAAPPAVGYARLARELGIPDHSLLLSSEPLDTAGEADAVAKLLGSSPFILITTAYHMPRAMRLMRRAGTHPIAAPVGQRVRPEGNALLSLLPGSGGLGSTERAIHEYMGLASLALALE